MSACFTVLYVRVPRLFGELNISKGDGRFARRLMQLARTDLLILDDWGLYPLDTSARHDLLEILDDRVNARSTLITSQLPIDQLAHRHRRTDPRRRHPRTSSTQREIDAKTNLGIDTA